MKNRFNKNQRRGGIFVYVLIAMTATMGICSLAVDLGRVQVAKTELRRAVDAAARAAAYNLPSGTSAAQNAAISIAAQNTVDGIPLVLQTSDVVIGQWNAATQTLNTSSSSPDTIQITGHRDASRGNSIQLIWGQVIGYGSCNLVAVAAAQNPSSIPYGFIGLNYITIHDNLFTGSYNSAVTPTPSHASYQANDQVESNGVISGHSGDNIQGNVVLGPSGSVSTIATISGSTTTQGSSIPTPTQPVMSAVSNPGGVSANPTFVNNTTYTWPGGTYYFTGWTIQNQVTINFTGAATVYINGNVSIQDNDIITAFNDTPGNLQIYQSGGGNTFSVHDAFTFYGQWSAPAVDLLFHDNGNIYGSLLGQSITVHDNDSLYLDQSLQTAVGGGGIVLVQ